MTVADTIWIATRLLHQERPGAAGFSREEISRKVREIDSSLKAPTVHLHLTAHCLAWKPAQPSTLRMLSQNQDGTLRVFRDGDPYHPDREGGRTKPKAAALPDRYRDLLDTSDGDRDSGMPARDAVEDPILALAGVGREMFARLGGGEAFINALREEVFPSLEVEKSR